MELIDESYPYAINTTSEQFKDNYQEICEEMVLKAKKTWNTKIWNDGLKIMKEVKQKSSTETITKKYIQFAIDLWE
jgi:hypothetical protein